MLRTFFQFIGILGITFLLIIIFAPENTDLSYERPILQMPAASQALATSSELALKPAAAPIEDKSVSDTEKPIVSGPKQEPEPDTPPLPIVHVDPYPFPPQSPETLNTETRSALVNILCRTDGGYLRPISGSGVIIDPRGVILTNAHVAQFVLLASRPEVNLSCVIRTGSPARDTWIADILYFPAVWVQEHAADIRITRPQGTGEHDYALLYITGSVNGTPLPSMFPYLPIETRSIYTAGEPVLLAAYPAEFSSGNATQNTLDASSAMTSIKQLMTFEETSVDVISLGGIVLAQSGSSGGAAVNVWGRLIGVISTTSDGETTADRNLRAITLSYINRALLATTDTRFSELLVGDIAQKTTTFMQGQAPSLAAQIIKYLE